MDELPSRCGRLPAPPAPGGFTSAWWRCGRQDLATRKDKTTITLSEIRDRRKSLALPSPLPPSNHSSPNGQTLLVDWGDRSTAFRGLVPWGRSQADLKGKKTQDKGQSMHQKSHLPCEQREKLQGPEQTPTAVLDINAGGLPFGVPSFV